MNTAGKLFLDLNKNGIKDPYEDPTLSFEERVRDLISRMTLEEKISQMENHAPSIDRLGIPEYEWWNEALHGYAGPFPDPYVPEMGEIATVFPQAIGMAATWDPDLIYQVSTVISDEARALNRGEGRNFWSPEINMARDSRWGRTEETYGEDPYLTLKMGVAFIRGLQGENHYLKSIATPKAFAVYSEENRRHSGSAIVDERLLREYYLPHFRACIQEGKAQSVMVAYNAVNGVPCCANRALLAILRDWGFEGFVVTDCGAIENIYEPPPHGHGYVRTAEEAVALAVNAGCDLICIIGLPNSLCEGNGGILKELKKGVEDGLVSEETIDRAVTRLFRARFQLGLFDPPEMVPYAQIPHDVVNCEKHRDLALRTAREGIVLLKNDNILPLDREEIKSIVVMGPNAIETKFGGYSGVASKAVSPLEGIKNKVTPSKVRYIEGCKIERSSFDEIKEATKAAEESDVAIIVVGIQEGEFSDREDLKLPGSQEDLILKVAEVNKNTIVVLNAGGVVTMENWIDRAPTVIEMWYGGEEGGTALADVLFGDYNPGGRLPLTFYRSMDKLPPIEDYDIRKGKTYLYLKEEPRFPFGHGLSYTKFEYSNLKIDPEKSRKRDVRISLDVKNVGRKGDEVVQLYIHDVEREAQDQPIKQLRGFKRITLDSGESKKVNFVLKPGDLAFYDERLNFIVEPGELDVMIGSSSEDIRLRGKW